MTSLSIPKQSVAGFLLAAVAIALGVYFGTKVANGNAGLYLLRLFYIFAVVILFKAVFIWGDARGFPIRRDDGRICFPNLFRNLVTAGIATPIVLILASPLSLLAFQFAR